jgi:hypothetical protein
VLTRCLRILRSLSGAAIIAAPACDAHPRVTLDEDARQYVRLAVALGERDPDSLDFYAGPADAVSDIRRSPPPLTAIGRDADALRARVSTLARQVGKDPAYRPSGAARADALAADLAAIVARVDLLTGARAPYAQESVSFFGIAPGPIEETQLAAIRARIAALIGGGDRLVDRYATFAARFTIPPARLQPVMVAALDACRAATVAHVTLPVGEQARFEFVADKPWSAFSRYLGGGRSVIQINTDFRFTVDQALQIACHEGYPGHHTRNTLRTGAGDAAAGWPERSVQLTFSPESLTSEASAMLAADVAFPQGERVRLERATLFPLAGLPAALAEAHIEVERLVGHLQIVQAEVARRYLDGQLEFTRAAAELEQRALVPHAEAQIKYINQYRSYVTTYTAGRAAFAARLEACARSGALPAVPARWRCFINESAMR